MNRPFCRRGLRIHILKIQLPRVRRVENTQRQQKSPQVRRGSAKFQLSVARHLRPQGRHRCHVLRNFLAFQLLRTKNPTKQTSAVAMTSHPYWSPPDSGTFVCFNRPLSSYGKEKALSFPRNLPSFSRHSPASRLPLFKTSQRHRSVSLQSHKIETNRCSSSPQYLRQFPVYFPSHRLFLPLLSRLGNPQRRRSHSYRLSLPVLLLLLPTDRNILRQRHPLSSRVPFAPGD